MGSSVFQGLKTQFAHHHVVTGPTGENREDRVDARGILRDEREAFHTDKWRERPRENTDVRREGSWRSIESWL
jgi:hypothetical protein